MPEPPPGEDGPAEDLGSESEEESSDERGRLAAVLAARRETLQRLEERGVPAFALNFDKDADAADIVAEFGDALESGEETEAVRSVAGRIVLLRRQGGVAFVVIRDRSGDIQLFCSRDAMDEASWTL